MQLEADKTSGENDRREALAAAIRTNLREGLPAPDDFAQRLLQRFVAGELTANEISDWLVQHYSQTTAGC